MPRRGGGGRDERGRRLVHEVGRRPLRTSHLAIVGLDTGNGGGALAARRGDLLAKPYLGGLLEP